MAAQHFRSAFNGFNREDVVHYIEYLNNQHRSQIEQLNSQLQAALAKSAPAEDTDLRTQLEAAQARITELEELLAQAPQEAAAEPEAPVATIVPNVEAELEAYRRAERTERVARERAQQIYEQANAVLADATAKAEAASTHIGVIADQVLAQLKEYQDTVAGTKDAFQEAVATLYAIRPESEEE